MLLELKVSNFAIIENLHIQFKNGLNILSGETGAGKSVLLKSLSLLMGGKGSSESIRTGASQASIEGSFDLKKRQDLEKKMQEMGIQVEDHLLVVRRVIAEEKNRVYLNGTLSTLNDLRDLVAPLIEVAGHSAPLIEMTGQHENRNLLSKSYHLDLLDQYSGTWDQRQDYEKKFEYLSKLQITIEQLKKSSQAKEQRLDFLKYQQTEIIDLDFQLGDDENIEISLKKLKSSKRLVEVCDSSERALVSDDDSALERIQTVLRKISELATVDPSLNERIAGLEQAKTLIEDESFELRKYISAIESDPHGLDRLESKLSGLRKLQKKYGPDVESILKALKDMETEIHQLENSDAEIGKLEIEFESLHISLLKIAENLHKKRTSAAKMLADSVNHELLDLNMKGVTFHVQIQKADTLSASGYTEAEFMSRTSSKDPEKPLAKFASGGELSRILLSLKRVIGTSAQPRTYLFDEVDTGVSGPTAEKVGKKLRSIAKGQQVICVTHLPQVAAYGDAHFYIQKSPKKGSVAMDISELTQKDRVNEIARLISGEKITKTSLAHAAELLKA